MSGFEGSYRPEALSPRAVMECRTCWTPYDPALGDETRAILPGTAFTALPADWSCPVCETPAAQFMVLDDPGAAPSAKARGAALAEAFREIHASRMRDVPFTNRALSVAAVGFRDWNGMVLGVLVTPWMMSLVLMPGAAPWPEAAIGSVTLHAFPAGDYEFLHASRDGIGPYRSCSIFAAMAEFGSQLQAVEVAEAVIAQLFVAENREQTDRTADIRRAAEEAADAQDAAQVAAQAAPEVFTPSRRGLMTGRLAP